MLAPMRDDPYRDFARVYDEWQMLYPKAFSLALAPRLSAAIRKHLPPLPILVDLACGTGTFAWWWQRTRPSWTVYATDRSPGMVQAARRAGERFRGRRANPSASPPGRERSVAPIRASRSRANARANPAPRFFVQDMRALSLPEPAGVATCLFDSLNHLTRGIDLQRTFRAVARGLVPRGLFLFDLVDERAFPEVFTGSSILDGPDLFVGIDTSYGERRGVGIGEARFTFFRRGRARWRRIEFDIRERRWYPGQVRAMLEAAGIRVLEVQRIDPYLSAEFFVPRTFWVGRRG